MKVFNANFLNQYDLGASGGSDYTGKAICSHPMFFVLFFLFYVIKEVAISFSMLQCCFAVKL